MPDLNFYDRFGAAVSYQNYTDHYRFELKTYDFDQIGTSTYPDPSNPLYYRYTLGDLGFIHPRFDNFYGLSDTSGNSSRLLYAIILKNLLIQTEANIDDPETLCIVEETPLKRIVERGGVQQVEYSFTISFYHTLSANQPNASEVL